MENKMLQLLLILLHLRRQKEFSSNYFESHFHDNVKLSNLLSLLFITCLLNKIALILYFRFTKVMYEVGNVRS